MAVVREVYSKLKEAGVNLTNIEWCYVPPEDCIEYKSKGFGKIKLEVECVIIHDNGENIGRMQDKIKLSEIGIPSDDELNLRSAFIDTNYDGYVHLSAEQKTCTADALTDEDMEKFRKVKEKIKW